MKNPRDYERIITEFVSSNLTSIAPGPVRFVHPVSAINHRATRQREPYSPPFQADKVGENLKHGTIESRTFDLVRMASRWFPANPNNPDVVRKTNATYVPFRYAEGNEIGRVANQIEADGSFRFERALKERQFLLLSGVRGVGKTSFMNFFLNSRTKMLEEQGVWWFRIDATKIHNIWRLASGYSIPDIYYNYYVAHSVYVMCVYGGAFDENKHIPRLIPNQKSEAFKGLISHLRSERPDVLNAVIDRISEAANRLRWEDATDISVEIVKDLFLQRRKSRFRTFFNFSNAILPYLRDNKIQFLAMVDGLDNIAWTKVNQFYTSSCDDFSLITEKIVGSFGGEHRFLFAARPETADEILTHSAGSKGEGFNWSLDDDRVEEWKIQPPDAVTVFEKKLAAAKGSDVFADERAYAAQDELEKNKLHGLLDEMGAEARKYPRLVAEALRASLGKSKEDGSFVNDAEIIGPLAEADILRALFDNDLRAFLDNVTKVFFTRHALSGHSALTSEAFRSRILQYVLLNGAAFMDSYRAYLKLEGKRGRANYKERGAVFPNIFWWPLDTTTDRPDLWHGFMGYRFLQIASVLGEFSLFDVMVCLNEIFEYSPEAIIELAEALVAYGLIDIRPGRAKPRLRRGKRRRSPFVSFSNQAYITEKGSLLKSIVFTRPELLYFYSLDTPLVRRLVVEDTRFVRSHLDFGTLRVDEDFFRAAVPTVSTFLLHVFHFDRIERQKINFACVEVSDVVDYLGGQDSLQSVFSLPKNILDTFLEWAKLGARSSVHRDRFIASDVEADVFGVLGGRIALTKKDGVPKD